MKISGVGRIVMAVALMLLALCQVNAATTLLPNGMQCFANIDGPLAGGSIYFYQPNTTTFKQTWQDAQQATANPQPVLLDSNGCATLYGIGSYRQVVYTGVNNTTPLFFDKITTDTSAYNSVFWAATAAGTPNVITVVDTGFNGTDGSVIQFVALSTNTGSATLNPSGFGAVLIQKDTTSGPVALTGGEIIQGNVISVVYNSGTASFHLLNTVIASAGGATAPLCGATGLKIINNTGTPNTIINMSANSAVMVTTAGAVINRSSVALTAINISTGTVTSTANGMDGEAPGTSAWLYIWMIDNGSAAAGLVSTSSTAPTMPSGYTYKCRMGAMRVDGSGNLLRTLQYGNKGQYVINSATNTTVTATRMANGVAGNPATACDQAVAVGNYVPATATSIRGWAGTGTYIVCPNPNWNVTINSAPLPASASAVTADSRMFNFVLESTNIYWASNAANSAVNVLGWKDAVNAN